MKDRILVLHTGNDALAAITEFAVRSRIEGASFSAIGAFQEATIAYWNWDTKKYEHIEVPEQVEVLALTPTLEVFMVDFGARLTRRKDQATGLWLLDL